MLPVETPTPGPMRKNIRGACLFLSRLVPFRFVRSQLAWWLASLVMRRKDWNVNKVVDFLRNGVTALGTFWGAAPECPEP